MFDCKQCGICCRYVGHVFFAKDMALPNGTCKYLDEVTNKCTIYNERPIFCNVDKYYDTHLVGKMTREEWYAQNHKACISMEEKYNNERYNRNNRGSGS